ncbi:hypothetical protein ILUMI_00798 [Ignelater luminosus]|uniref:Uncharacterized protein n=1 Tax=Ignelater luminosus TaxID=2038154 RepID=A0A8K0DRZ1_IGNLU|nr:hypothetical protein ILUMI_00798 [Ignelater luminosus]
MSVPPWLVLKDRGSSDWVGWCVVLSWLGQEFSRSIKRERAKEDGLGPHILQRSELEYRRATSSSPLQISTARIQSSLCGSCTELPRYNCMCSGDLSPVRAKINRRNDSISSRWLYQTWTLFATCLPASAPTPPTDTWQRSRALAWKWRIALFAIAARLGITKNALTDAPITADAAPVGVDAAAPGPSHSAPTAGNTTPPPASPSPTPTYSEVLQRPGSAMSCASDASQPAILESCDTDGEDEDGFTTRRRSPLDPPTETPGPNQAHPGAEEPRREDLRSPRPL